MNQNVISELANSSMKEKWSEDIYNGSPVFVGYELDVDEFAKQIIQTCISICMGNQFTGADSFNNGSVCSAEMIKDYFGVDNE